MPEPRHYLDLAVIRQQGEEATYREKTDENGHCPDHSWPMTDADAEWLNTKLQNQESLQIEGMPNEEAGEIYYG